MKFNFNMTMPKGWKCCTTPLIACCLGALLFFIISTLSFPSSVDARCPNGTHKSPSGVCETVTQSGGLPRCPDGFHRSPSGDCESVSSGSSGYSTSSYSDDDESISNDVPIINSQTTVPYTLNSQTLVPNSAVNAQQAREQTTTAEPSPEINGHFYMSTIFNLDQDLNLFKASNGGSIYFPFEKKNLTGFEIVPETEWFGYDDANILWGADVKIPIDQTRTMVKRLHLGIDVSSIEQRVTTDGIPGNFYAYSGSGTLSIGEEKWNIVAKFEPEQQTAWLRVKSI